MGEIHEGEEDGEGGEEEEEALPLGDVVDKAVIRSSYWSWMMTWIFA